MKKILKKGMLIIVVIVTVFLFYSNKKISGTWVGTYEFLNDSPNIWKQTNESVLEFNNLKFREITPYQNIDSIAKRNYLAIGNYILTKSSNEFETFPTKIRNLSRDSLTLIKNNLTKGYRKIPDSLKYNSSINLELKNGFFKLIKEGNIDSVYFSEKFLFFRKERNGRKYWDSTGYWELRKVNDFYILFSNYDPIIVRELNGNLMFYQVLESEINVLKVLKSDGAMSEINRILERIERNN